MSEQGKFPVGTLIEDTTDNEIGFVIGHRDSANVMAWFCDLEGGDYVWQDFGTEQEANEARQEEGELRFVAVNDPKPRTPERWHALIDKLVEEKLAHVFVWIWMDGTTPNVNVYQDIADLTENAPVSQQEALRAVAEPGESVALGDEQWLRFVLKG